jgi:tetratricopeptide (TPR) repeat protein
MAERIKHPVRVGGACAHLGLILAEFGRPDEAEPYLQRATEIFEGTGEKFYRYLTRAGRGLAALRRGEPAAARRLFTDGIAFAREIGTHIILNRVIAWRAESSLALGDVQEADRTLTEAGEAARVAKDRIGGGIVRLARARALMAEPVPALDRVEAELRTAAALLEEMGAKAFLARAATGLAHLLAQRGAGEEAARWREQARAIFSQGGYAWDLEILEKGAVTPTA